MEKEISDLAGFVCSPVVVQLDQGLELIINRKALFSSSQYQGFSKFINNTPKIADLVKARSHASSAHHGDIARGITEEAISYCWKRSSLKADAVAQRLQDQIHLLSGFRSSGYLPVAMAILLPIGIEEKVAVPEGTLEPLSESTLRYFSDILQADGRQWLEHGGGKAVFVSAGPLSYAELVDGNLSRGPDHNDHYGLILLQLAIILHQLGSEKTVPLLEAEMACQSGAISGGTGFSRGCQHAKPQLRLTKDELRSIAAHANTLHTNKFPHFPAKRFVDAFSRNRSQEDRLVDCVTGWEGLLMPGEKSELGFRLSLGLALLLDEAGSGANIATQVRKIYGIRSAIVHGDYKSETKGKKGILGQLKYELELRAAARDALAITKKLLNRLISDPTIIMIGSEKMSAKLIARLFSANDNSLPPATQAESKAPDLSS